MIQKFELNLPKQLNLKIISSLINLQKWKIASDVSTEKERTNRLLTTNMYDGGFYYESYNLFKKINEDSELNLYAEIILFSILEKLKFKDVTLIRFWWNYYNKSSKGQFHKDYFEDNMYSFVYSLNTNNGGTYIKDENTFFRSNEGEVLLFKSNEKHMGVGPTDICSRFNLNCVFKYDN